jgi:hypothetical protein
VRMKDRRTEPNPFTRSETLANLLTAYADIFEVGRFTQVVWCDRAEGRFFHNAAVDELSRRRFERPAEQRRSSRPLREEDLGIWPDRLGEGGHRGKIITQQQKKHPNRG